ALRATPLGRESVLLKAAAPDDTDETSPAAGCSWSGARAPSHGNEPAGRRKTVIARSEVVVGWAKARERRAHHFLDGLAPGWWARSRLFVAGFVARGRLAHPTTTTHHFGRRAHALPNTRLKIVSTCLR